PLPRPARKCYTVLAACLVCSIRFRCLVGVVTIGGAFLYVLNLMEKEIKDKANAHPGNRG
ncbi:MAG: hypothetical protein ACLVAA_03945, partial [Ruthenibacterium sp.]